MYMYIYIYIYIYIYKLSSHSKQEFKKWLISNIIKTCETFGNLKKGTE